MINIKSLLFIHLKGSRLPVNGILYWRKLTQILFSRLYLEVEAGQEMEIEQENFWMIRLQLIRTTISVPLRTIKFQEGENHQRIGPIGTETTSQEKKKLWESGTSPILALQDLCSNVYIIYQHSKSAYISMWKTIPVSLLVDLRSCFARWIERMLVM